MLDIWTLPVSISTFVIVTGILIFVSNHLTKLADQLADITRLGEAFFGAVFLGCFTSLAGIITSVVAAYYDYPDMAVSNAMGSIVIQTAFLGVADLIYTRANLEHAAASLENILQSVSLIIILAFVVLVILTPLNWTVWGIDPASLLLILIYFAFFKLIAKSKKAPMWHPRRTTETVEDIPVHETPAGTSLFSIWAKFLITVLVVAVLGYLLARAGMGIVNNSGLSESFVGAIFTGISSSVAELLVTIAAVRQGALTLAVSNIIGGNLFDMLFLTFSDLFYRHGSIYKAVSHDQVYMMVLAKLMVAMVLFGLLYREKEGPAGIGWESVMVLAIFLLGYYFLFIF